MAFVCYTIQPYKVVNASLSRSTYHTHNPGSFHRSFTVGCLRDRTVNARRHSGGFGSSDAPAPDFLETRNSVSSSLQSTRARPRGDSNPRPLSGGVGVRVGRIERERERSLQTYPNKGPYRMHIHMPLPGPSAIFHTWRHRDHTTLPPEGHAGGKGNRHAHKFGNESLQATRRRTAVQKVGRQAKRPDQSGNSHASVVARHDKPSHDTKRLRAKK